jgi:hypothetical protein
LIDRVNRLNTKVASRDPSAAIVPDALPSAAPAVSVPAPATQPDSVGG